MILPEGGLFFNSLPFVAFFLVFFVLYFLLAHRLRIWLIVIGSYYFYMSFGVQYALIILIATIVSYLAAKHIDLTQDVSRKRSLLIIALAINLGMLIFFKYINFISSSINSALKVLAFPADIPYIAILLPIGISFYTFQSLSYVIDVYRGKLQHENNFIVYAAYVCFFPQIVSGPITRAGQLIEQFYVHHRADWNRIAFGAKIVLWGLFLKLVVADRLSPAVNHIYDSVHAYSGPVFIFATYFFSFQLYADFAGYTFIAIGIAKILGFDLMRNFRRPYFSKNISEFWRRWHISLSTWFQDYVFTPLYLFVSRRNSLKKFSSDKNHLISFIIAIMIVEVLLGLWHGANWTFILFGAYHGVLISLYYVFRKRFDGLNRYLQMFITFNLVSFGFIFFRANSVQDAFYIINSLFTGWINPYFGEYFGIGRLDLLIALGMILIMECVHIWQEMNEGKEEKERKYLEIAFYCLLVILILIFGVFDGTRFIYQQF